MKYHGFLDCHHPVVVDWDGEPAKMKPGGGGTAGDCASGGGRAEPSGGGTAGGCTGRVGRVDPTGGSGAAGEEGDDEVRQAAPAPFFSRRGMASAPCFSRRC